jgi:cobalamin biosynthesis Mg chelatase CobN
MTDSQNVSRIIGYIETAQKRQQTAQFDLTEAIGNTDGRPEAIQSLVQSYAENRVADALWIHVGDLVQRDDLYVEDEVDALRKVVEYETERLLTCGADDTWSGRGNDLKRVEFDAKRNWLSHARLLLSLEV